MNSPVDFPSVVRMFASCGMSLYGIILIRLFETLNLLMIRCINSFWFSKFFVDNKFEDVSSKKTISTTTGHCSGAVKKKIKLKTIAEGKRSCASSKILRYAVKCRLV